MYLLKEFYGKLPKKKIQISDPLNKKPILMTQFLDYLTVPVVRDNDCLGKCNGWTAFENKELNLIVGGGIVNQVEYLETIQFGKNLNFVNPFYLHEIITQEGLDFFYNYYADEITTRIENL